MKYMIVVFICFNLISCVSLSMVKPYYDNILKDTIDKSVEFFKGNPKTKQDINTKEVNNKAWEKKPIKSY